MTCIEWALQNVHVVSILTGLQQSFYVSMADHVYVALKVPKLKLQSSRCAVQRAESGRCLQACGGGASGRAAGLASNAHILQSMKHRELRT